MRAIRIIAVLLVTALCLAGALWNVDLSVALSALAEAAWIMLLPMWGLYIIAHTLRVVRLGILIGQPVPFTRLFSINSVGFLAINVIPLRMGELVRPWLLAEREGVPFGRGMAAIFIERLLDMMMLLLMLLGLTWLVELPEGGLLIEGIDVIRVGQRLAGFIAGVGTLFGVALVAIGEPALSLIARLPLGVPLAAFTRRFREGLVSLLARPAQGVLLLGLSASIWLLTIAAIGVFMTAFPGIPTGLGPAWSTWSITLSGMAAVPTPGFFGSFELFCSSALWLLWGVDRDLASAFAIALHMGQFLFTVGLGAAFLVVEGLSMHDLVRPLSEKPRS
ncbi:MAG: hypothetical protein ACI8S6_004980 [Myxococcota bacterium]